MTATSKALYSVDGELVLASRSSQRYELLAQLVSRDHIRIVPPRDPEEAGFDHIDSRDDIAARLLSIAQAKSQDVREQLGGNDDVRCIIAADTVIVVGSDEQSWRALGQPPESDWQSITRRWFREYYAGKSHHVMTALHVTAPAGIRTRIVTTTLTFRDDLERDLEAYLATGESRGKAGGYAIQGLGSLFAERVEGSLSNVIGLPLRELAEMLREVDVVS